MHTDPVCGMDVDPATAAGRSDYQGKTYYFVQQAARNPSMPTLKNIFPHLNSIAAITISH